MGFFLNLIRYNKAVDGVVGTGIRYLQVLFFLQQSIDIGLTEKKQSECVKSAGKKYLQPGSGHF